MQVGLNQYEGQSTASKGWFKPDIGFPEFYKALFKNNIEDQHMEVYKKFLVPFDKELIKRKY